VAITDHARGVRSKEVRLGRQVVTRHLWKGGILRKSVGFSRLGSHGGWGGQGVVGKSVRIVVMGVHVRGGEVKTNLYREGG